MNNELLKTVEEGTFAPLKSLEKLDMSVCKRLETLSDAAFEGIVDKTNVTDWRLKEVSIRKTYIYHYGKN